MLNSDSRQRLKDLLPAGLLATKPWLQTQGLSMHFIDNAIKSHTLTPLVPGVYVRDNAHLDWKGVVASLQRMATTPIHVGGISALDLEGLTHYQSRGKQMTVGLYSTAPLPSWLNKIGLSTRFEWHGTRLLWPATVMAESKYLREDRWRESLPNVLYSGPEKAMLEVLAEVPKNISFEHADQLMQGLSNLSPRKLDALLRVSSSVKAKRLFMWLAQRQDHAWLKHLTPEQYEFGSGKRELACCGRLDKVWNITVPREM